MQPLYVLYKFSHSSSRGIHAEVPWLVIAKEKDYHVVPKQLTDEELDQMLGSYMTNVS